MKTITLFLTSFFLGFLFCLNGQIQNPGWSLPPNYTFNDGSSQTISGLPSNNTASNASNMQLDANGDMLFYIVDNEVRDVDGDLIGDFRQFYESANWLPYMCMGLAYTSEILIIQDPNNCNRYYVVSSAGTTRACNDDYVNPFPNATDPFMAVIDFDLIRPSNPNKKGAISSVEFLEDLSSTPQFFSWLGTDIGGVLFAASKLQTSTNEKFRYVFVSYYSANPQNPNGIARFKIGSSGMEYDGLIPFQIQNADGGSRAEMELIELPNGKFRIACPYGSAYSTHAGKDLTASIYIADLDATGNAISGSEKTLYFYRNSGFYEGPFIHGLEFSPDGSKLFITHDASFYHDQPFEYYDFNNFNNNDPNGNGIYPLNITSSTVDKIDFQNSQIELATDGKIYLGAQGRLASLSNPNNPSANNFMDNIISLPGYQANYGGDNTTNIMNLNKSYTLPDQVDGMIYENFAPTVYNETSYTATSGTWQPGNGSNPWNSIGDVYIENELIIPSGKNVTIQNMVFRFGPDARVIIEQGAKLTIDAATLVNARPCNNEELYWQGVQVYGTSSQHQFPENNPTHQGMLELINGGTIENAHKAATNWKEGSWNEIGGVIKSTDGVFRNNRRGVEFMAYQNFHPSNSSIKRNNTSKFTNTYFLTDDDFIEGYPQQSYATLWKVQGIQFINCHFENNLTSNKSTSSSPNEGISSLDASFSVLPKCDSPPLPVGQPCPTNLLLKSGFVGLESAVQIAGAGVTEAVTITQTDFINNTWGVYVKDFDNININRNNFVIGNSGYNNSLYSGNGIYLVNSVGYIVEENSVQSNLNGGKTSGIVVDNGGPTDNKLYKNALNNLFEGTKSNRENRSKDLKYGLQFLCNDYISNDKAIIINSSDNSHGVRLNQGTLSPRTSAGNTFQFNDLDIVDYANQINYFHFGGITLPDMQNGVIGPVLEFPADNPNHCPSSFKPSIVMLDELQTKLDEYELDLTSLNASYSALNYNYVSLIDNGNTDILQGQIENSWSSDAWTLRSNLMQEAPYLSTEALLKAAGENILPNAMLLEILLANPDATKGEEFLTELDNVMDSDLPEYMLNYVRNNWDTETVRTIMEGEMSFYQSKIATATNFIKYLEKSKEEHTYSERLATVLKGEGVSNLFDLIDFFIENKEWLKADSVMQAINMEESLRSDIGLLEDFDTYIDFRSSLGSRNLAQLDSTEVQYLETLAEKGSRASGYVENILCFFYDICYDKEMPEGQPMAKVVNIPSGDDPKLEELMYNITVYPNPASDFSNIKWEIFAELNNSHYKIFDLNGREMRSGTIDKNEGEKVIDTRSLTNGVYIINIYNDGIMKMNSKLIVDKEK